MPEPKHFSKSSARRLAQVAEQAHQAGLLQEARTYLDLALAVTPDVFRLAREAGSVAKPGQWRRPMTTASSSLIAQSGPPEGLSLTVAGEQYPVQGNLTLGRHLDNDVIVPGEDVLDYHVRLELSARGLVVHPFARRNGGDQWQHDQPTPGHCAR